MGDAKSETDTERFVRLLVSSQHELFAYAFSFLRNAEDAREVNQEAAVLMWQHFHEYDVQRPFLPWACTYTYFSVLNFRKRQPRAAGILSEEALEALAADYEAAQEQLEQRAAALAVCVEKLPAPARHLLNHRYHKNQSVQQIAKRTNKSVNTLYKAFEKIRAWLLACVKKQLAANGAGGSAS